jgi:hypothetical protein
LIDSAATTANMIAMLRMIVTIESSRYVQYTTVRHGREPAG